MSNHTYYLEVSAEAGMASDEQENPSEAYLKISFDSPIAFSEEQILNLAAKSTMIEKEHLRSITEEEYKQNMDDGEVA